MVHRRLATLLLIAVVTTLVLAPGPVVAWAVPSGPVTVRVQYRDEGGLAELVHLAGDVQNVDVASRTCTVATNAAGIATLSERGYGFEVLQNDAPNLPVCYRTVSELYAHLQDVAAAYPALTQLTDIGDSWDKVTPGGASGFDLWAIRLTNEAITGVKPRLFADGGIHARELATLETAMELVDYLLSAYGTDPDITALLDYNEVHVVVDTNPDGHLKNEINASAYWRKNTDSDDGCSGNYGVDLNRNQDFKWGCCGGSSGYACDETYRGPTPASEPEILAYETYVRTLFEDQRGEGDNDPAPITATGFLLNYHSYGGDVLHPWGWTDNPAPNSADLIAIAKKYAAYNGYQVLSALYPVDGNTRDWAYGELGIPGYVVEMGNAFYESCTTLPGVIHENITPTLYMIKLAEMPYLRIHGPQTNNGIQVLVAGAQVTVTATVSFNWAANPNSQNVGGAELYLDVPPIRGGTPIPMVAVDGSFNSPTEVVRATADISALPLGRHLAFVRGRGVNAYQGYQTWGPVTAAFVDLLDLQYWQYAPLQLLNAAHP